MSTLFPPHPSDSVPPFPISVPCFLPCPTIPPPAHLPILVNHMSAAKFDKLTDDNYMAWFKWMRAYLVKQDVWGIVSGAEEKPMGSANSKPVKTWIRKRDVAAAEILLHVSEKYISHCVDEDPAGTWTRLQLLFHAQGQTSIAVLRREFHSMLKRGEESMREWITRVETIVYQLKELDSPLDEIDIINTLTRNIGDEYSPLIVQFDTLLAETTSTERITVPYVMQRLISEEKRLHSNLSDDLFANYAGARSKNTKARSRICYHCGEEGHFRNECDVTPRALHNRKAQSQGGKDSTSVDVQAKTASTEGGAFSDIEEISIF
jgi:gag-polypeptide of LTR copia-type/Zinc knuckle